MAAWGRDTSWRQGHILPKDTADALRLFHDESPDATVVVVVSNDCDLAASPAKEPCVEVIVGRAVPEMNGEFTQTKHARMLHLEFHHDPDHVFVELSARAKRQVAKDELAAFHPSGFLLDAWGRSVLQRWLAARYRRATFPDVFEQRLSAKLRRKIAKALTPTKSALVCIFFDVDHSVERDRDGPDDCYELGIYLLYDADDTGAEKIARDASDKIETAFEQEFFEPAKRWQYIELLYCDVLSSRVITWAESRLFQQWRLDHLSLATDAEPSMMDE
jgi:hypothetical protein